MQTHSQIIFFIKGRLAHYNSQLFLLVLLLLPCIAIAQGSGLSTKSKKAIAYYQEADNYRVRRQYQQAISLLNQAIKKDDKFIEAYIRLGTVYLDMGQPQNAKVQYEKALALKPDGKKFSPLYLLLGKIYLQSDDYEQSKSYLKRFLAYGQTGERMVEAKELLKNVEYALSNDNDNSDFKPRPLSDTVNRFVQQYFPVLTADQKHLIFTRRLGEGPYDDEDLVIADKDINGRWGEPQSISQNINSKNNEGTCTISADGRMLIFTSCYGRKGYGSCDLFVSYKTGDAWSEPKNLGGVVNSSEWESQPSLSADGRVLYFVSTRRGGIGKRDIYVTKMQADGQWSRPQNLGPKINTIKDEVSPFIHANGLTLYFASNGHTGFGGFDIFYSELENGGWSVPKNIGRPVNTGEDQLSLFITADGKKGYYSHENLSASSRVRGKLYEFDVPESMQVKYKSNFVTGKVLDEKTREPLSAQVELFDLKTNEMVSLTKSDPITGEYMMVLTEGSEYALYVDKEQYLFKSLSFDYQHQYDADPVVKDVFLQSVTSGVTTTLQNLFFDVDKYDLKDKSKTELQKVFRFLEGNPNVKVEIGGHTDNSGSAAYNQQLSLQRAKSVFSYLTNLGIPKHRLTYKGYGQNNPIAPNDSEENKKKNRRIDFLILNDHLD